MSIKIYAKSFFSVLSSGRTVEKAINLPDGTTAEEAFKAMGISPDEEMIILINQRPSNEKTSLSDTDKFTIIPPVSAA